MAEAKIFYESDCNLSVLDGKTVAIIGFGSQGHAHALNLHESGVDVVVGLYEGSKSWSKVENLGLSKLQFTRTTSSRTSQRARHLHLHTALTFTSNKSFPHQMLMYS